MLKFRLLYASNYLADEEIIVLKDAEALLYWLRHQDNDVVFQKANDENCADLLIIYDDYLE